MSTPMHPGAFAVGDPSGDDSLVGTRIAGITDVRLLDSTIGRVDVAGGVVAASPQGDEGGAILDAGGWRLIPGPVEPHAHLDKALTAHRVPPGAGLDLVGAVNSWHTLSRTIDAEDVRDRALAAVRRYVERGFTGIRTHVNVSDGPDPLSALDVMVELRERLRDVVTLQLCLLPGPTVGDDVVRDAIDRGIDVLGGCPHLAPDPHAETSRLLDLAERSGLPIDLHTDEQTGGDVLDLVDLAQQVLARGLQQRVTASHCVRLGSLPPDRLAPVLELTARAGIGVVGLPITNLYLQGWDADHLVPRGITAARAILDAGIAFGAGGDNLRDPFNPVGRADPFETSSLLVTGAHLRPLEALAAVTSGARAVTGMPPAGGAVGDEASFLLVPDTDLGDVVAGAQDARVVVHRGLVVADTRVRRAVVDAIAAPLPLSALAHSSGR